jgi:hypothetical protein
MQAPHFCNPCTYTFVFAQQHMRLRAPRSKSVRLILARMHVSLTVYTQDTGSEIGKRISNVRSNIARWASLHLITCDDLLNQTWQLPRTARNSCRRPDRHPYRGELVGIAISGRLDRRCRLRRRLRRRGNPCLRRLRIPRRH